MKYSKGVSWTDDCRIPYLNGIEGEFSESYLRSGVSKSKGNDLILNISGNKRDGVYVNQQGRFTPNLLVCDDMLNDGRITKTTASKGHIRKGNVLGDTRTPVAAGQFGDGAWIEGTNINDKGSSSRFYDLDLWFNKVIDEIL
jgi:hypothetical protein